MYKAIGNKIVNVHNEGKTYEEQTAIYSIRPLVCASRTVAGFQMAEHIAPQSLPAGSDGCTTEPDGFR